MAVFKTHRFLPEVFQTNANKKFLMEVDKGMEVAKRLKEKLVLEGLI